MAPGWDELRRGYFSEALRDKAIALAEVKRGETASDIGAGTGFVSEALMMTGLNVIAVDESQEMLDVARKKLRLIPTGKVRFLRGPAAGIPLEDGTADYVFANMLLHHVEEPEKVLREMARVLKPGGSLVVTDMRKHGFEFLKTEQHDRWMGFEPEEVEGWLEAAGFEDGRVVDLKEDCCAESGAGEEARVGIFAAVARKPARKIIK